MAFRARVGEAVRAAWSILTTTTPEPPPPAYPRRLTELAAFLEDQERVGSAREDTRDDKLTAEGFRKLSSNYNTNIPPRDLMPLQQDRQNRLVMWLWERNPLAKWLIETSVDFTLGEGALVEAAPKKGGAAPTEASIGGAAAVGEAVAVREGFPPAASNGNGSNGNGGPPPAPGLGVTPMAAPKKKVETPDPKVREILEEFLEDAVNRFDQRLPGFVREFGLYGELCLPVFPNALDGHVRYGYVDPMEIDEVIADPENTLTKTAVILKARKAGEPRRVLKVVRPEAERSESETYGLLRGVLPGEQDPYLRVGYDGACLLWQTNILSSGKRGRSDLLPLIDWLDGYDQFLFDAMDQAILFNSFVYDIELNGMSEPKIKEWAAAHQKFTRGQNFVHNEKAKLSAVSPDLKAMDKDSFARILRGQILGSMSYPEHWYGLAGSVNFAAAKEMGLPPVKRLTRRQNEVRYIIRDVVQFVLDQAVLVGRLDKDKRKLYRIILPELSMKDQAATVAAATSLTAALQQSVKEGWLTDETAARLVAALLSQLGIPIDAGEEYDPAQAQANADYAANQQNVARLAAQLGRQGQGNGDNVNEPKKTTVRGGQPAAA